MLSLSSLIEFLLDMLRDEATQAEFARDPSATLAARGLADVSAQDIRDVQPMLSDVGGVHRVTHGDGGHGDGGAHVTRVFDGGHSGGGRHSGGEQHDVVREIHHVTQQYEVVRPQVTNVTQEYKQYNEFTEYHHTDNSIHADEGATVVKDSFNQDNDGVDNKGGTIDDSVVGGGNVDGSGNDTDVTVVEDSFDDDHSTTVTDSLNDTETGTATDVGNDDSTDVSDSYNSDDSTTVHQSFSGSTVNDSYAVDAPAATAASGDELVGAEHV